MKDMTFEVNENGKNKVFNIIKYFKNPNNNENYIIYKEDNNDEIYASRYIVRNNELELLDINSDDEWDYIDKILGEENE